MAKYRAVQTEFWEDPRVIEEMTPEDKLFYLYLLTNPKTTQIGIYQITKKQMAFELGYSTESINALMDRFENHHRIIKYNLETREICILNWAKYNLDNHSKPVLDCIESELKKVKDKSFIMYMLSGITKEKIRNLFLDAYELSTGDTTRITDGGEKEKQKQKEKQKEKEKQQQEKEEVKKVLTEVVDEISKYFLLEDEDVKKVANTYLATGKEINYLIEKLKLVSETPDVKNVVGYLLKAIQEDYKPIIGKSNNSIPSVKTRFHNINQSFKKYAPEQLEKILQESQKGKFN